MWPSSRRQLRVLIRSGIHIFLALNGTEKLTYRFHLTGTSMMYIVHNQPRLRKLSGPDVSLWTSDQGYHRELLVLTAIYYCRSGGMVTFTLPFTAIEMISVFHITNLTFLSSNIPSSPVFGVLFLLSAYTVCPDLTLICKLPVLKLIEIVILWVYYTIPFDLSFFRHFWVIVFQLFHLLSLAKDHWRGFNTRNAHMVHIVN